VDPWFHLKKKMRMMAHPDAMGARKNNTCENTCQVRCTMLLVRCGSMMMQGNTTMLMMENVNNVIFLHGKIFQSVNPDMNAVVHGQDAPRAPQLAAEKKTAITKHQHVGFMSSPC